jgi:hypothetical protein
MRLKRLIIYAKDIQIITGRGSRNSMIFLNKVRKHFNKPPRSLVTIDEFCAYTGLPKESVEKFII